MEHTGVMSVVTTIIRDKTKFRMFLGHALLHHQTVETTKQLPCHVIHPWVLHSKVQEGMEDWQLQIDAMITTKSVRCQLV